MAALRKCRPLIAETAGEEFMVRTMKMNTATKDKESQLEDKKIYLFAELTVLPGSLEEIKSIFKEALIPTLQEPGCEALYETGRNDDPHKLVFFAVFSSAAAHEFHLAQDYAKRMFALLEGKVSGVPTLTKLSAL
jgi:quinol monooxygenase YgiN